jgi:hypothetical protein
MRCWAERTGAGFVDLDKMLDVGNPRLYMRDDVRWNTPDNLLNYN